MKGRLVRFVAAAFLIVTSGPAMCNTGTPELRIEPAKSKVGVGESFTLSVIIKDASDLGGFQCDLIYDSTIVTVDDVRLGDFLESTGRDVVALGPIIDNHTGKATFGVASYGTNGGAEGTGTLAVITFTSREGGVTDLELQRIWLLDTGSNGQTFQVKDASVEVIGPTAITLSSFDARSPASQPTFFRWQWLVLALGLASGVVGVVRKSPGT